MEWRAKQGNRVLAGMRDRGKRETVERQGEAEYLSRGHHQGTRGGDTILVSLESLFPIDCATPLRPLDSCAPKDKQLRRKCINSCDSWRRPAVIKRNIDDSRGLDTLQANARNKRFCKIHGGGLEGRERKEGNNGGGEGEGRKEMRRDTGRGARSEGILRLINDHFKVFIFVAKV